MAQINLAPQVQLMLAAKRRQRRLYFLAGSLVVIMLIVWSGLWFISNQYVKTIQAKENQLASYKSQLAGLKSDNTRMNNFESRLASLNKLISQRRSWNPIFQEIEKLIPANTVINTLEADLDLAVIKISAYTPTLDDVSLVIASFENEVNHSTMFQKATVLNANKHSQADESGAVVSEGFNFNLELYKSKE
jgi:Tfp pilus assembly protein PilN